MVAHGGSSVQGEPHPGESGDGQLVYEFHGGHNCCCCNSGWDDLPDEIPAEIMHTGIQDHMYKKIKSDLEKGARDFYYTDCEVRSCCLCLPCMVCCMLANEEANRHMKDLCKDVNKYKLAQLPLGFDMVPWERDGTTGKCMVIRFDPPGGFKEDADKQDDKTTAPGSVTKGKNDTGLKQVTSTGKVITVSPAKNKAAAHKKRLGGGTATAMMPDDVDEVEEFNMDDEEEEMKKEVEKAAKKSSAAMAMKQAAVRKAEQAAATLKKEADEAIEAEAEAKRAEEAARKAEEAVRLAKAEEEAKAAKEAARLERVAEEARLKAEKEAAEAKAAQEAKAKADAEKLKAAQEAARAKLEEEKRRKALMMKEARKVFKLIAALDVDGTGNGETVKQADLAKGMPEGGSVELFKQVDINTDGELSIDEWLGFFEKNLQAGGKGEQWLKALNHRLTCAVMQQLSQSLI